MPLLLGPGAETSEDELKALGAAAASSGAVALFHVLGRTPEATTIAQATGTDLVLAPVEIDAAALQAAAASLCPVQPHDKVAAVCLGTPHFSRSEFRLLSRLVGNCVRHPDVTVYVSTSREIAAELVERSDGDALSRFGVNVVVDTCSYLAPMRCAATGAIVTNSAKFAHYGPGNLRRRVGLLSLERCIASARLGHVAPE